MGDNDRWWDKETPTLPRDPDESYAIVRDAVLASGDASTANVQRTFAIGFNRASYFIERLEGDGLISQWNPETRGRTVLSSGRNLADATPRKSP